jgi:import inner membrane translocase subunit TIM17
MEQTPCPDRIVDDLGSAFAMGAIGGTAWHAVKGARNSPRGDRLRGAFNGVSLRAPTLGGNFAVWGGLFATFDCTYSAIRRKEDPWNSIAAGATTGGILAARAGWKSMGRNAIVGGCLLAMIEGLGVAINKMMGPGEAPPPVIAPPSREVPALPALGAPMKDMKLADKEADWGGDDATELGMNATELADALGGTYENDDFGFDFADEEQMFGEKRT